LCSLDRAFLFPCTVTSLYPMWGSSFPNAREIVSILKFHLFPALLFFILPTGDSGRSPSGIIWIPRHPCPLLRFWMIFLSSGCRDSFFSGPFRSGASPWVPQGHRWLLLFFRCPYLPFFGSPPRNVVALRHLAHVLVQAEPPCVCVIFSPVAGPFSPRFPVIN